MGGARGGAGFVVANPAGLSFCARVNRGRRWCTGGVGGRAGVCVGDGNRLHLHHGRVQRVDAGGALLHPRQHVSGVGVLRDGQPLQADPHARRQRQRLPLLNSRRNKLETIEEIRRLRHAQTENGSGGLRAHTHGVRKTKTEREIRVLIHTEYAKRKGTGGFPAEAHGVLLMPNSIRQGRRKRNNNQSATAIYNNQLLVQHSTIQPQQHRANSTNTALFPTLPTALPCRTTVATTTPVPTAAATRATPTPTHLLVSHHIDL